MSGNAVTGSRDGTRYEGRQKARRHDVVIKNIMLTGLLTCGGMWLSGMFQPVQAAPLRATLPDGRQVILFDDQTWQYDTPNVTLDSNDVPRSKAEPKRSSAANTAGAVAAGHLATGSAVSGTALLGSSATGTVVKSPAGNTLPSMPASSHAASQMAKSEIALSSMTSPALPVGVAIVPGQTVADGTFTRSDIGVTLLPATYRDHTLSIPTSLENFGINAVIRIDVTARLLDEQGKVVAKQKHNVWTSIKRMPESYFRPDTTREGRPLVFDVPKASRYFLDVTISTVEFR